MEKFQLLTGRCLSILFFSIMAFGLSKGAMSQQAGFGRGVEPIDVTASSCEVRFAEFESACDLKVRLLDSKEASFIFVTVISVPEEHEISFYTEHVGMLVVGMDDAMMVTLGRCRNSSRSLRCRSDDRAATLEIRW